MDSEAVNEIAHEEAQETHSKDIFNRVADKNIDPIFSPDRYPEGSPKPLHGRVYTLLRAEQESMYGLVEPSGRPDSTIKKPAATESGTQFEIIRKDEQTAQYSQLLGKVGAIPFSATVTTPHSEVKTYFSKIEAARAVLEHLEVWGNGISTGKGINSLVREILDKIKFGLWPGKNNDRYYEPWIGDFAPSKLTDISASGHFEGFAAILIDKTDKGVEIPALHSHFYPPSDLLYIVPSEEIKQALFAQLRADVTISIPKGFFENHFYTLDEIISGKLTTETLAQLNQKRKLQIAHNALEPNEMLQLFGMTKGNASEEQELEYIRQIIQER